MATLALFRGYQGEALLQGRRAIEACAFASHIHRHPEDALIWLEAGMSDEKYNKYRQEFKTWRVFQSDPKHPDYRQKVMHLKHLYDFSSKTMHASMIGMVKHLGRPTEKNSFRINYQDHRPGEPDQFEGMIWVLQAHVLILSHFGDIFADQIIPQSLDEWRAMLKELMEDVDRQARVWEVLPGMPGKELGSKTLKE